MKLSIHTTITDPDKYQYAWREALECFCALADEVIIVNGGESLSLDDGKIKEILLPWPEEWHWSELPVHLNAGLDACSGDWALKMDIDYLIHESDFSTLRFALEEAKHHLVASLMKCPIVNKNHFYRKCDIPFAINKALGGNKIKYGKPLDGQKSDWCYPIFTQKEYIRYGEKNLVPEGRLVDEVVVRRTGIDVWDYDYFFRTKEIAKSEFWRFSKAYATVFDKSWGSTEKESWNVFCEQMKGRVKKAILPLGIESHPRFIKERILAMTPQEYGFNNWNNFENL